MATVREAEWRPVVHLEILGPPCTNAFSPSANIPSEAVDARICSVMLMDDSSGVWTTALSLVDVRILETMCAPSLWPCIRCVSFQRRTRREITRSRCFFSDHIRLRGVYNCHRLEIKCSLPFRFDCFRKLRLLFGRKVVPRYLVGVPSTAKIIHKVCLPRLTLAFLIALSFAWHPSPG